MPTVPGVTAGDVITESWGDLVASEINLLRPYNILNARGQIIRRGAAAPEALTLGASGRFLRSDGTDPTWQTADFSDLTNYGSTAWTPGLALGGASVGMTYTVQSGLWKRLGSSGLVLASFAIILSALGSSTGAVTLTGLPVTVLNANHSGGGPCTTGSGFLGLSGAVTLRCVNNGTTATVYGWLATGTAQLTHANLSSALQMQGVLVFPMA